VAELRVAYMTSKQYFVTVLTIFLLCVILSVVALNIAIKSIESKNKINEQTQIEKTRIQEIEKTKRTKERMKYIPWYNPEN